MKKLLVRRSRVGLTLVLAVAIAAAAYGATSASSKTQKLTGTAAVSGSVTFDGVWTGSEQAAFAQVIKAFNKVYPNVKIKYKPLGNNETRPRWRRRSPAAIRPTWPTSPSPAT